MYSTLSLLSLALSTTLPLASAHIGLWHPAALDFDGDGYTLVEPLSGKSQSEWWFHGNLGKASAAEAAEPMVLKAGGSVTVELSCNKESTSYGGNPSESACPTDTPSLHAGDNPTAGSDSLLGCGLAIAYKSSFADVQPADFTIFSVNHDCVLQRETSFEVPANLPSCEGGKCICSWFWQGQESADEMYMTGFACNVEDGASGSIGEATPAKYCKGGSGCVTGPKQPLYWANSEGGNLDTSSISYQSKPAYNDDWGFPNGAQDLGSGGAASGGSSGSGNSTSASGGSSEPTSVETTPAEETGSPTKESGSPESGSPEYTSSPSESSPPSEEESGTPEYTAPPSEPSAPFPEESGSTYTPPAGSGMTPPVPTGTGGVGYYPSPSTLSTMTKPVVPSATSEPETSEPEAGSGSCSWAGHCEGATCSTENDCSDDLTCISGKCGSGSGGSGYGEKTYYVRGRRA